VSATEPHRGDLEPIDPQEVAAEHDDLQRIVAVFIMVVTLVGALFAFLQTQAGNREARAQRDTQAASVRTTAAIIQGRRDISRNSLAWELQNDQAWLSIYYEGTFGPAGDYAAALGRVHDDVQDELKEYSEVERTDTYKGMDDVIEWGRYYEDQYRESYEAAELEKGHRVERDAWADKGDQYVAVITILAVALFLLGLSLTVPGTAQKLFVVVGIAVAVVSAGWGAWIWQTSVEQPDPGAIDAYVDGLVLVNSGDDPEDFEEAVARLSQAIEQDPSYVDAYVARGNAHFELDFLHPDGPQGSEQARDDYRAAVDLGLDDHVSWGNLGAAEWWLDDYDAALASIRRAFEHKGDDMVVSLNYAEALLTTEGLDSPAYLEQLRHLRELLGSSPSWLRDFSMSQFYEAQDLAIRYRPDLAERQRAFKEALMRMHHEIDLSFQLYDTPRPEPVNATMTDPVFTLSDDGEELLVEFDYEGVEAEQDWLYHTYIDGLRENSFSTDPEEWPFTTPDGGVVLTFTEPAGFSSGSVLRTEVFLEGNLLTAGELTVP
jgi:tetratricopeptide (TPR) repeat protein